MSSISKLNFFIKDCLARDKNRIKMVYYKSIELYENFEFYRLRSKIIL